MITGEAAPKDHHADHEDGGSDEVDCTGLEGAGGGLTYDDFIYETFFEALDGFYIDKSGAEVVDAGHIQLSIDTLGSANSYVTFYKKSQRDNPVLTWDKERRLRFAIWANSQSDQYGDFEMVLGYQAIVDHHIGFVIYDGVLKGSVGNGTDQTTVDLFTIAAAAWTYAPRLELHHYPGDRVDFYVNDVLTGTIDTPSLLPSGTTYADSLIGLDIRNNAHAKTLWFRVSNWKFWQAA